MKAPAGVALTLADEKALLAPVAGLAELCAPSRPPAPGVWTTTLAQRVAPIGADAQAGVGDVRGGPLPDWVREAHALVYGETTLCRAGPAFVAPRFGAVITADGAVLRSTAAEMLAWRPDLARLPSATRTGEVVTFAPPEDLPLTPAATVWAPFGASFNYGHFLLDGLSSLLAVAEAGLTARALPIAPPLKRWQRDLLALAFPGFEVIETRVPLLKVGEAAFSTGLDHFLHHPNTLIARLRARILDQCPQPRGRGGRVYLSRRGTPMRVMVNEAALERALRRRGFAIVHADRLSVARQIALMRGAEIVVGASGAAMANALFTEPGARVVEIQPQRFTSRWVDMLCRVCGQRWTGYFCPAPIDRREAPLTQRLRRGFQFAYHLPLEDFLSVVDGLLGGAD